MVCLKCGHDTLRREYDRLIDRDIFVCFKCGFRKYSGYPIKSEIHRKMDRGAEEVKHAK